MQNTRYEISQRLTRARTGLHEQMPTPSQGSGNRVGHMNLPRPVFASDGLDRSR